MAGVRAQWQEVGAGRDIYACNAALSCLTCGQEAHAHTCRHSKSCQYATITQMHHQKLASLICFQALVGCLRPTTDSETLSKDPKWLFELTRRKFSSMNMFIAIKPLYLVFTNSNTHLGSLLRVSKSVVGLKQPTRARKHI